jgi:hypothetical protein
MAAQKIRRVDDPKLISEATKLTPEQRKAIYAPMSVSKAPKHLEGNEWVKAWKTIERLTFGLTAFSAWIFGGLVLGESKKGIGQK